VIPNAERSEIVDKMRSHTLAELSIRTLEFFHINRWWPCTNFPLIQMIIDDRNVHNVIDFPLINLSHPLIFRRWRFATVGAYLD
jgi:hypothetical protein